MRKRFIGISLFGMFVLVLLASCETPSYSSSTLRTAETRNAFVSVPMIVEYDTILNQRVIDTSTFRASGEVSPLGGETFDYASLKEMAVINCSRKYGCDILVNPTYDITNKSGIITIVVSGMPAKYKRIRQATESDMWMLRFYEN